MTQTTAAIPVETLPERTGRWARECLEWAKVPFLPPGRRVGRVYDIVGPQNLFGEDSLFINLGYWHDRPATLDEASRDLARLLARTADLNPSDIQVDVGFGYGDQDFLWAREFAPKEIIGLNIATEQIAIATRRATELGLADRIRFQYGSAVAIPLDDASCTKVTALESAFHFPSYPKFFAEAHRILQPGGKLVTADITPRAYLPYYRNLLRKAGFQDVDVYSIRDDVYPSLARHLGKRLRAPDMRRVNPLLRATFSRPGLTLWGPWADYIIATATKP
ncbi:methyltransferase domain-containing protein [Nocardia yamanashiensis]|uniref:methyltransferase domain-containing protein n=1 Tax=Nocardia yamanashiensis TaxID=209247 RepID=UPI00082CC9E1|nr:methyltransferase domain-containing protein [Nocardia yamanashiensis]